MYKCVSFYSANRMLQERQSAVIAAWSVVADEYYHYDMKIDELGYPRALCLIRTIEGRGRIQTGGGGDPSLRKGVYPPEAQGYPLLFCRCKAVGILLGGFFMGGERAGGNRS